MTQTPQQQQQQGAPQVPRDLTDNASLYPMMNQIYKEFDHLSPEEQKRIQSMFAAAVQNREKERQMEMEMEDSDNQVKTVVWEHGGLLEMLKLIKQAFFNITWAEERGKCLPDPEFFA